MNPRHASALALVGWYLMVPPLTNNGTRTDAHAALSTWQVLKSLASAPKCEAEKNQLQHDANTQPNKDKNTLLAQYMAAHSQCIASDDPRLKEK
jgi:hypothetical protein